MNIFFYSGDCSTKRKRKRTQEEETARKRTLEEETDWKRTPEEETSRKRTLENETAAMSKALKEGGYSDNLRRKLLFPTKRLKHYSEKEICEAVLLRALSPKAYEMLRKNSILPLPHRTTLARKVRNFQCSPGLQNEFFNLLKLKLSVAEEWEQQCILMFDEMQISQSYAYCARLKRIFPAHKKVQVALLRKALNISYSKFESILSLTL